MSIAEDLDTAMKDGMRQGEKNRVACIRQVKAKLQETVNAKGFSDAIDDALYLKVIASYVKSTSKAIVEMESAGDKTKDLRERYQAEVDYLQHYLPKLLSEAQTKTIVDQTIDALGVTDPKQSGRVMGTIMKDNKGKVDPALVKKLVGVALSGA